MKDAPINLPPHWYVAETGTVHVSYVRDYADQYARAAVLADRAGREDHTRRGAVAAAPSPSESYKPTIADLVSGDPTPIHRDPGKVRPARSVKVAEPPAAPVQQAPVAWMHKDAQGQNMLITESLRRDMPKASVAGYTIPLYTHPDADLRAELLRDRQHLAAALLDLSNSRAERDSLRALLQRAEPIIAYWVPDSETLADIRAAIKGSNG